MCSFDDDEGPDPDYGVFGDTHFVPSYFPAVPTAAQQAQIDRQRRNREHERQISSNFNRYMIDLYNGRTK